MNQSADELIQALQLEPLPVEGGYFRRIYTSIVRTNATKVRRAATSIYYLLKGNGVSAFHQLKSDEVWYWHCGSPAVQLLLMNDGTFLERVLGPDILCGEFPQSVVPAWTWQATVLTDRKPESWALFSTAVVPGYDDADFLPGDPSKIALKYPDALPRIQELGLQL